MRLSSPSNDRSRWRGRRSPSVAWGTALTSVHGGGVRHSTFGLSRALAGSSRWACLLLPRCVRSNSKAARFRSAGRKDGYSWGCNQASRNLRSIGQLMNHLPSAPPSMPLHCRSMPPTWPARCRSQTHAGFFGRAAHSEDRRSGFGQYCCSRSA